MRQKGNRREPLFSWAFIILSSLIITFFLAEWLLPLRSDLVPDSLEPGWISARQANHRAYFRQTFILPFKPEHAWVALSADDYDFYVNGKKASSNKFSVNAGSPLQGRASNKNQRISIHQWDIPRNPTEQRTANEEWRLLHYLDITPLLHAGNNTLAIFVQSPSVPRFAIKGEITGGGVSRKVSGRAEDWQASPVPQSSLNTYFFQNNYASSDWQTAEANGPVQKSLYATIAPEIITTPKKNTAITGTLINNEIRLATELPESSLMAPEKQAWIRITSSWPYYLFLDDRLIASGSKSANAEAYDLTQYLAHSSRRLSIRLTKSLEPSSDFPYVIVDGQVGRKSLASNMSWSVLTQENTDWLEGTGEWSPAQSVAVPRPEGRVLLSPISNIDLEWILQFIKIAVIVAALLIILVYALVAIARTCGATACEFKEKFPYWCLSIPLTEVLLTLILRLRYGETDSILWFHDPVFQIGSLVVPAVTLLLSPLLFTKLGGECRTRLQLFKADPGKVMLVLILIVGFVLRYYRIDFDDLQADENVSWDAARGIVKGASPKAVSGVFYTRSPLYHYLLGTWLWIFGDYKEIARSFSVLPGVGVIAVAFFLTLRLTQRVGIALLVALLIAIDPWHVYVSRIIRFYQFMQFFGLLTVYYFLRGFIWREGKRYQNLFFLFCTITVLCQEVFVVFFPAFCVAGLLYYKPFDWRKDLNVIMGFTTLMSITVFDMAIFTILCLTAHVGIATTSGSIMQLHFINPHIFFNLFFVGNHRATLPYTLLFLSGFIYWFKIRRPDPAVITLYGIIILTLTVTTFLLMQIANRYVYALQPILMILAVMTAHGWIQYFSNRLFGNGGALAIYKQRWVNFILGLILVFIPFQSEPESLAQSYSQPINMQHETAYEFIADHKLKGDKLLSVSPMSAAIIFGGLDYYLMELSSFDEVYNHEDPRRGIVDRWGGGRLVSNTVELEDILQRTNRLWIVMDEVESKKLTAEMQKLILNRCQSQLQVFGGEVFLCNIG
jgi:hypothetical protein